MHADLHGGLDIEDLEKWLNKLEEFYDNPNFNYEVKFTMLQKGVSEQNDITGMALFRGVKDEEDL